METKDADLIKCLIQKWLVLLSFIDDYDRPRIDRNGQYIEEDPDLWSAVLILIALFFTSGENGGISETDVEKALTFIGVRLAEDAYSKTSDDALDAIFDRELQAIVEAVEPIITPNTGARIAIKQQALICFKVLAETPSELEKDLMTLANSLCPAKQQI